MGKCVTNPGHYHTLQGYDSTLWSTKNSISYPFTMMDIEPKCQCPCTPYGRIIYTQQIWTSSSSTFTITKVPPPPPPTNDTSNSYDCMTTLTANADSNLQDFERSKLNQTTNYKVSPPISGEAVIGNLLKNKAVLIPIAIDGFGRFRPIFNATPISTKKIIQTKHIQWPPYHHH